MAITKAQINVRVDFINKHIAKTGLKIVVGGSYGRINLDLGYTDETIHGKGTLNDSITSGTKREIYDWLSAFTKGFFFLSDNGVKNETS